ncbi:MAG: hypothetical protein AAF696_34830, partial [Bacteroidota bacterium]
NEADKQARAESEARAVARAQQQTANPETGLNIRPFSDDLYQQVKGVRTALVYFTADDCTECETWEAVIETIDKGLEPYKKQFYREITEEDIVRLTEIRIKRISKFNSFKADELIRSLEEQIAEIEHNLAHLVEFSVSYFEHLLEKFGKGKERKAELMTFDNIQITQVAVANQKLYVNRKEGFVGYGLKKDEFVRECSDLDDVIVFRGDGKYLVTRVQDKAFVGKNIIHVDVWKKGNERKVYHAVYRDPKAGKNYIKRFAVTAITRDREYDVTKGSKGSKLLYFQAHLNSESEIITVNLTQSCRAKKKVFDFDLSELAIKGRASQGNVLTKYPIRKITQKSVGASTLGGRKIWYDDTVGRLNVNERGLFLGEFDTEDRIVTVFKDGSYELGNFELTNRYDISKVSFLSKLSKELVITAVHYEGKQKEYYVKRFQIETTTMDKKFGFISEEGGSKLIFASVKANPHVTYKVGKGRNKEVVEKGLADFIDVKGWKAMGNKLDRRQVSSVKELIVKEPEKESLKSGESIEWSGDDLKPDGQGELF